jgi:hypothetical protein
MPEHSRRCILVPVHGSWLLNARAVQFIMFSLETIAAVRDLPWLQFPATYGLPSALYQVLHICSVCRGPAVSARDMHV